MMPASKKPRTLGSPSQLLKFFKKKQGAAATAATTTTAAAKTRPLKTLNTIKEDVSNNPKRNVTFRTSLCTRAYDVGETHHDYEVSSDTGCLKTVLHSSWFSPLTLNGSASAYDVGETHYDYEDSRDTRSMQQVLHDSWLSIMTLNDSEDVKIRKDIYRKMKKANSEDERFNRLVTNCGNMLGVDCTLRIYGKMGHPTGKEEYKKLLALNMERTRETDDHEVLIDQNYEAFEIFKAMSKKGFLIEEDTYGPFLKHLIDKDMVKEFYYFLDFFKDGESDTVPILAYYEMLLHIRLNDKDKIKQLIDDYSLYDGEDKRLFQESYLLAMCESDCRRELLMLLETFDVTKASSVERLSNIFKSLGMLSMEAYAQKFLLELKTTGAELATLRNYIYDYAISIPTLEVKDGGSKFKQMHSVMEMVPTSKDYEKLIRHYCKLLEVHVAIDLADETVTVGGTISLETIHTMLEACMKSYEYNMGDHIHSSPRVET